MAKLLDGELTLTLGGIPGWTDMQGRTAGDVVTLDEWLASFAVHVETSEGPRQLTTAELVCVWAEHYGATHEDWTIDEAFSVTLQWDGVMKNELAQIAARLPLRSRTCLLRWRMGRALVSGRSSEPPEPCTGLETNSSTRSPPIGCSRPTRSGSGAVEAGRDSNRLYLTREARESAEFMPDGARAWRPADALRDGLTRSAAHELAIVQRRRSYGIER